MGVEDIAVFGVGVLLVGSALLLALVGNRISRILRVPAPALFLLAASAASDLWPPLGDLTARLDERIVTVALILILFDGGMSIGWRRFRSSAGAVLWVGIAGTIVTAGGLALASHLLFGFSWTTALLLGTALAPTDPAVVFSVLGGREIGGRSGTILEGESGANDPVGIALIISILGVTAGGDGALTAGGIEFAVQMLVGLGVGLAGGLGLLWVTQHVGLPDEALYPLRILAGASAIYGLATLAHGSGFLAVFLAGIVIGDADAPYKPEIERFASAMATLGEIVAFGILGLTLPLTTMLGSGDVITGLVLAGLLIFVIRPVLVGLLLLAVRLRTAERLFIAWAGLKGAVPILLGIFLLDSGIDDGPQVYRLIFVVVLVSVLLQGSTVPLVAAGLRIPMHDQPPQPYAIGLRLRRAPDTLRRSTVEAGSPADGCPVGELGLDQRARLSLASRDGKLLALHAETRLQAGDQVLWQIVEDGAEVASVFSAEVGEDGPAGG